MGKARRRNFLTVRLTEDDHVLLDEARGKQNRSDFVRGLLRRSAGAGQQEVNQFINLLTRIEQKITSLSGSTDTADLVELTKKIAGGMHKMIEAGKGITATQKEGGGASDAVEKALLYLVDMSARQYLLTLQAVSQQVGKNFAISADSAAKANADEFFASGKVNLDKM